MIINYRLDKSDTFETDETAMVVDFGNPKSFSYTFWRNHNKLQFWYSAQALDLLYISMAVFVADRLSLRDNASDGWSREFSIYIPVLEYDLWEKARPILEEMLNFLSGDSWSFCFRKRIETDNEKTQYEKWKKTKSPVKDYDQICMFSGGLDSFIGAINQLEQGQGNTLFISHYGGGKGTKEY